MNPDTGHLVEVENDAALRGLIEEGYQRVPAELAAEAEKQLGGRGETYVDLGVPSPLSQWAAEQRKRKEKKKTRNRRLRKENRRRKGR